MVQALQAPPSRRHSKEEPLSLAKKVKLALEDDVGSLGFESIVVWGAARSIMNERLDGASTFPATSVARTRAV